MIGDGKQVNNHCIILTSDSNHSTDDCFASEINDLTGDGKQDSDDCNTDDFVVPSVEMDHELTSTTNTVDPETNIILIGLSTSSNFEEELVERQFTQSNDYSWYDNKGAKVGRPVVRDTIRLKVLKDMYPNVSVDTIPPENVKGSAWT